jgi:hypothetical protein
MPLPAPFGFEQLVTELLRGLTEAIGDRPGETDAQRFARHQTAIFSVMAFLPRDGAETMLASQCVMLDNQMRDSARDMSLGEYGAVNLRARGQFIALGRLFLRTLAQLRLLQARPVEQVAMLPEAKAEPRPDASPQTGPVATSPRIEPPIAAQPPSETPQTGQAAQIPQTSFQNRSMRRALRFKNAQRVARP